jgi:diadenosine tetraphosphate (Ap4A) HIT family hydrolase
MRPMNCPFCREFVTGVLQDCPDATFESRILKETPHFVVVPDISPLTPGHVMILPKSHIVAFGALDQISMTEAVDLIGIVKTTLSRRYEPPIVLEHGTSSISAGGGCVSHAHLHFFPRSIDLAPALSKYNPSKIAQFRDLRRWSDRDVPYVFFETASGELLVADELRGIPRQFIRIEIARQIGLPDPLWNWRNHILLKNLEETMAALRDIEWS